MRLEKCPIVFVEGKQEPLIAGNVTDDSGAVDITGFTVRMTINRDGNFQDNLSKDATLSDATAGEYTFGQWASTDLKPGINQEVQISLIDGSGNEEVLHGFLIDVRKAVS